MTVLLAEMTRDQIKQMAPGAVAVLPTAAIEQHGPHLPIVTDTLILGTVAQRAGERATSQGASVAVAPVQCYGNSHHHFPFAGVMSLTSDHFMAVVTDLCESLVRSGFRKILVLNGHGGNTDSNRVVSVDMINLHNHPITISAIPYWDVARPALVERGLLENDLIPGHAGHFETSLVMALRPDLVDQEAFAKLPQASLGKEAIEPLVKGFLIRRHGTWGAGPGYTDVPASASAEKGRQYLNVAVETVGDFLAAFHREG